eukprot:TRINITY_DN489_c0_g1_i3.p1 TRINITY_DN489_c0_g1~~TRINITY_DN489_c0_g1_i3.p1  ORF type:complete len:1136 (-),score=158.66 TRINITY_DN489_c0_g1_i3:71-3478(-)
MIFYKSYLFCGILILHGWLPVQARFIAGSRINLPQNSADPLQRQNVLDAISDAYGSDISPKSVPNSYERPASNFIPRGGVRQNNSPYDNPMVLEAVSDTYGVDISLPVVNQPRGPIQNNAAPYENQRVLEAISDAYGSDISPILEQSRPRAHGNAPYENPRVLEAISEAYGSDISPVTNQPANGGGSQNSGISSEEQRLLNAISDTYGSDISPVDNVPHTDTSRSGWARTPGAVQPHAQARYRPPPLSPDLLQPPSGGTTRGVQGHTGHGNDDHAHAHAPPIPGKIAKAPENAEKIYSQDNVPFIPTIEELAKWEQEYHDKQIQFFKKYKSKGDESVSDSFTKIDMDYYSEDSIFSTNRFNPNREFFYVDHNVTKTDIGKLDYKLVKDEKSTLLDYKVLRLTPHGRHLLLITLLEDLVHPLWLPRFKGRIMYYLPDSLKPVGQPNRPPKGAILLKDIVSHGRIVQRDEMLTRFRRRMPSVFRLDEDISRFNLTHGDAVGSLLEIILGQETFDSTLSILVFIHSYVHPRVFLDTVLTVIDVREDVGFVLPMMQTINPYDYFQIVSFKNLTHYDERMGQHADQHRRFKRQAMMGFGAQGFQNTGLQNPLPNRGQVWRISWNEGIFRTLPVNDPESQLWYFREDPLVSAHHLHWHLKMSNMQVPVWHPSNGLNMDRRGEMFYFMHKQMLCRYNADRIGLNMPLTTPFLPEEWRRPISPGYDPKLTESSGRIYPPRPDGALIPNPEGMEMAYRSIRQAIREGTLRMVSGPQRLGYAQGVDYGISALGDALEAFVPSPILGNLHNDGHQQIGQMHQATMRGMDTTPLGVMGNPNGAVRDPLFFRWHKVIDDIHQEYKNTLQPYGDEELDFPGVTITEAHVQSEGGHTANTLYTYMDTTTTRLQSIDLQATDGSSVNIAYDRLNHIGFSYHVNIQSRVETQGIMRIFLIPAGIRLPAHTDVTQVAVEMDRFLIFLNPGSNYFTRRSTSSPFVTKSAMPLVELQERLLMGQITEEQFNWSGCGWPQSMVLPRGREGGMPFRLYIMVSQVLPGDSALTANWERMQFTSWSWCGVRRNEGDVPDSRPMGFPLDRAPPNGNWQSLMFKNGQKRGNHIAVDVSIRHDPIGTTSRTRNNNNNINFRG